MAVNLNFTIVIDVFCYLFVVFFYVKIEFIIFTCSIIHFFIFLKELTVDFISIRSFKANDGTISQVFLSFGRRFAFGVSIRSRVAAVASRFLLACGHRKGCAVEGVSHVRLS